MHLTLKAKLVGFGGLALATLLFVAAGNQVVTGSLRDAFSEYSRGAEAVQKQLEADMAHDAIRGDVYAALAAAHAGDGDGIRTATADLQQH